MRFTDKYIKALKPKEKSYVVTSQSEARGVGRLQLKIYPTGTKRFQFQFYFEGRKRMEIGAYGPISLADAKKQFILLSDVVQNGKNPAQERIIIKEEITQAAAQKTMLEMVEDFFIHINKNWAQSTIKRSTLMFKRNLIPFISIDLLPSEFTTDSARELIYKVYNRGAKAQAGIFRSDLMSLCKFAIDFDNSPAQFKKPDIYGLKTNPIREISFKVPVNAGQRWLTENELYTLWHSKDLPKMTSLYYRLAIALAGQRVCEVYHAKLSEFDLDEMIFTIPVERIKIKKRGEHLVPISELALPIIKELAITRNKAGHLWPHRDKPTECAHVSTIRMSLQRWCKENTVAMFSPRDMRRTCKTLMGKAGISKEYRDLLQQHSKSDVSSVHYDRYDYMKEKREAMDEWTKYLEKVLVLSTPKISK
jgi:integrase